MPMSLQLEAYLLMKMALDMVILLNFFKSILYKIERPKWLRKVIISNFELIEYMYIAIRRGT